MSSNSNSSAKKSLLGQEGHKGDQLAKFLHERYVADAEAVADAKYRGKSGVLKKDAVKELNSTSWMWQEPRFK